MTVVMPTAGLGIRSAILVPFLLVCSSPSAFFPLSFCHCPLVPSFVFYPEPHFVPIFIYCLPLFVSVLYSLWLSSSFRSDLIVSFAVLYLCHFLYSFSFSFSRLVFFVSLCFSFAVLSLCLFLSFFLVYSHSSTGFSCLQMCQSAAPHSQWPSLPL